MNISKIRFQHYRYVKGLGKVRFTKNARKRGEIPGDVRPHGGETHAFVTLENGVEIHGVAHCSKSDIYCKSVGRALALRDAEAQV